MKAFALLVGLGVVAVVLVADLGCADQVFRLLEFVPGRDLTGHFGVFALLSFSFNSLVVGSGRRVHAGRARVTAVLAALVALEELSQAVIPARTFSLLDLSASLAGLVAGAAASLWHSRTRRGAGAA